MPQGMTERIELTIMSPESTYSSIKDFGPEAELLCHCARKEIECERSKQIVALLEQDLNWDKLLQMADYHHILPLVYSNLTKITPNHVPKGTLNLLRDHYFANVVKNGYKTKELLKLLKIFQAHNIRAIPYKGAILSTILYGDPLLRYYSDLDLLIFRKDLLQEFFPNCRHRKAYKKINKHNNTGFTAPGCTFTSTSSTERLASKG